MKRSRLRGDPIQLFWRAAMVSPLCLAAAPGHALDSGLYLCRVEKAELTTESGGTVAVESGPREFLVSAFNAPRASPLDRENSGRVLDYHSEGETAAKASVEAKLFEGPTTELSSADGVVYEQQGNVFQFTEDGKFKATGRASIDGVGAGVVVYVGTCKRR